MNRSSKQTRPSRLDPADRVSIRAEAARDGVAAVPSRRAFLATSVAGTAAFLLACGRDGQSATPAAPVARGKVDIVEFDNAGKRLRVSSVERVVKSDAEWRKQLSAASYQITRQAGTERPFTGALLNEHARGVFRCICCDTALYDSRTKYESHTGWPSFWQPIARQNVVERRDSTLGMVRTEILCPRCDAHLGHVFDDGPQPTGLRYCMNSVALAFTAA